MTAQLATMAAELVGTVKVYIGKRLEGIVARIDALEKRQPEKGDRGEKGIDGVPGERGLPGVDGKDGAPGKDADAAAIAKEAMDTVIKFLDEVPIPKDGAPGRNGERGEQGEKGERGEKGDPGEPGTAGKDGAPGLPGAMGERGLPGEKGADGSPGVIGLKGDPGERGQDGLTGEKGERGEKGDPGIQGKDGAPGLNGKDGAPGINGKDADPELILRMVKDAVGLVPVPKDGKDGKDGRDAPTLDDLRAVIDGEVERRMALIQVKDGRDGRDAPALEDFRDMLKAMVADAAKDIPPGRDGRDAVGKDGKDGADGLGFDDMEMEEKDDRTIAFVFRRGDREKRFEYTFPTLVDRGTYKSGAVYERGDTITYGGSLFIAQRDTLPTEKPEDGSGAFRLAVKRGRDGS